MGDLPPTDDTPPRPLEYRRPGIERRRPPYPAAAQAVLGLVAWVIAAATWVFVGVQTGGNATALWTAGTVLLGGLVTLVVWLWSRHRWRAFVPGVLIGLCLTCLVPVGIVAVVCKPPW